MGRIRTIKPTFFRSRSLAKCSIPARLTFQGLWCEADDHGRGVADARIIGGVVWPLDDAMTPSKVEAHIEELSTTGHIRLYVVDGERYYEVVNWEKHQAASHRRGAAVYPLPPAETSDPSEPHDLACDDVQDRAGEGRREQGEGNREQGAAEPPGTALVLLSPPAMTKPTKDERIEAIFEAWQESTGKRRTKLEGTRKRIIENAMKLYPDDDLIAAVRGWRHSPHNRGENKQRTVYNDLGLLLRDAEHIERFRDLELGDAPVVARQPAGWDAIGRVMAARQQAGA